jgi:hypothetical protein
MNRPSPQDYSQQRVGRRRRPSAETGSVDPTSEALADLAELLARAIRRRRKLTLLSSEPVNKELASVHRESGHVHGGHGYETTNRNA